MLEQLQKAAFAAMEKAYAPYSRYAVGAALLGSDGKIYTGCNVENASYGLSMCAERVALGKGISEGCREFTMAFIAARGDIPWPCGACRQVLNEFAREMTVYAQREGGEIQKRLLVGLLPDAFEITKE